MSSFNVTRTGMSEDEGLDLTTIFHTFMINRWLISIVTILCLACGWFYASNQTPLYQSEALLQIDGNQSDGLSGNLAQKLSLSGGFGRDHSIATQVALMQSPYILEPVINELGLNINVVAKKDYFWNILKASKKIIKVNQFIVQNNQINQQFKIIFDKEKHIKLYDDKQKLILQGEVGSKLSSPLKNIILQVSSLTAPVGSEFHITKLSNSSVVRSILPLLKINESSGTKQVYQSTGILSISLTGTDPFRVIQVLNSIIKKIKEKDEERKSEEASQTLEFLYHQLPIEKKSLAIAENILNRYRAKSGKIDIKLQTQFLLNHLAELDNQLSLTRIKQIDEQRIYTPNHPAMQAITLQLEALIKERIKLELQLKKLPASDQIAANLMREVGVKKSLYLILLNKIQELEVIKAGTLSGIHILSLAKLPEAPLSNKKILISLGGLFFGIVFSILIIFARKIIYPRIDDPEWSEKEYNLPNLAVIPFSEEQENNVQKIKYGDKKKQEILGQIYPRNLAIESIRSLRTSLQVALTYATNNVVSIMGVAPGVGKSFVSVNLAYLIAAAGKRVILVDADLRKGVLHNYINPSSEQGLAEVLSKNINIEQAINKTDIHDNLHFLSRGAYPQDPSELLMSERLKLTMDFLSQQYDVVLIDTAPILLVTDAVLIGVHSATNYLVLGAGSHQPDEIEIVLKRLSASGVSLQGTIFNFHNNSRVKRNSYYYGKYGRYNTYYADDMVNA